MVKIVKILVKNLKAIKEQELILDGCSVIVTAGNGKGKTTLLKSLFDRIKGEKNENILRTGESEGSQSIDFNDGNKLEWKVTDKTESFILTTKEGLKVKSIKQIKELYFGNENFDINEFLELSSSKQAEKLMKVLNIDLTELESKYKEAYEKRKEANYEFDALTKNKVEKPLEVEKPEIESIKKQILDAKKENSKLMQEFEMECDKVTDKIDLYNSIQSEKSEIRIKYKNDYDSVIEFLKSSYFSDCFDREKAYQMIEELPEPDELSAYPDFESPKLIDIEKLESKLNGAYQELSKFELYEFQLTQYNEWVEKGKKARELKDSLDVEVKAIEKQKREILESANLPEGFSFNESELLYNNYPLDKKSQSTSALYIAGLKLATINLGTLKTIHFEASALDKESLNSVYEYAKTKNLQLFIERPDFEGGEIQYKVIEEK